MTNILHISSSPRGDLSESIALADAFLTGLAETRPDVDVEHWDLWDGTLPEFGPDYARAKMTVFAGQEPTGAAGEYDYRPAGHGSAGRPVMRTPAWVL